jgi:predicted DCC family thiol-disulfide oxidoreductase YuxK
MIRENKRLPTLYYDSGCPFCTKTKRFISKIDSKNIQYSPITPKILLMFKNAMKITTQQAENSMFYTNNKGITFLGSKALFAYLRDKKGIFHLLGVMGTFSPLEWYANKVYECLAINRYKISLLFK